MCYILSHVIVFETLSSAFVPILYYLAYVHTYVGMCVNKSHFFLQDDDYDPTAAPHFSFLIPSIHPLHATNLTFNKTHFLSLSLLSRHPALLFKTMPNRKPQFYGDS